MESAERVQRTDRCRNVISVVLCIGHLKKRLVLCVHTHKMDRLFLDANEIVLFCTFALLHSYIHIFPELRNTTIRQEGVACKKTVNGKMSTQSHIYLHFNHPEPPTELLCDEKLSQ